MKFGKKSFFKTRLSGNLIHTNRNCNGSLKQLYGFVELYTRLNLVLYLRIICLFYFTYY